ncbi:hypothetical protein C2E25_02180 [Geothermobacter hydrogeniphilus]|uniref:15-methylpalmitoyl-4-hydroxy-2-pyrone 4-O-methyltransferase n=1 Tax=Geothermobacter hydrogeniphilus TaxID=1969733 RepID=A0A2K2HDK6_9BACT|nr:isoprenylcysteine carboxylmethyltransferase family protein [Geothermobacter hydrogeniphilus]PNU21385.1 hypothetical protein C2E25_02180 [Geothermobacter hydrogeniphilus]
MGNVLLNLSWFYLLLLIQRGAELLLCARNRRRLQARGGREYAPRSYRGMVALYLGFHLLLLIEAYPFRVPADLLTWSLLTSYGLVQLLRYWTIGVLGDFWNTRIVVIPGSRLVRTGPFRWLRHPNYLVMTLEFAIIPLLLRAPTTLLLFIPLLLVTLRRRIALEEEALSRWTDFTTRNRDGKAD